MIPAANEKTAADSRKLSAFIAVTVLDSRKLQKYLDDPERVIDAAGLSNRDKEVLITGTLADICRHINKPGAAPAPDPPPDDGGGAGG